MSLLSGAFQPWVEGGVAHAVVQALVELATPNFDASGIVADFLDRIDVRRHVVCAIPVADYTVATLSVMRSRRAHAFSAVEQERLAWVCRHLQRSFRLSELVAEHAASAGLADLRRADAGHDGDGKDRLRPRRGAGNDRVGAHSHEGRPYRLR